MAGKKGLVMSKRQVLILLPEDDTDCGAFSTQVESDSFLSDSISLRFSSRDDAIRYIPEAEVLICGTVSPELILAATNLKWINFWSAGLDGKVTQQIVERGLLVTNSSGVHATSIAEHVFGYMLMFTRNLHLHMRSQVNREWNRNDNTQRKGADELEGKTLGIVGLGRIGEALTTRAQAFGMRVIASKRDVSQRYNSAAKPELILPSDELPLLLRQSDHVVICLPYTSETHHLFDTGMLKNMKPSAYLYNIARGKIVDEDALIEALRREQIAGAGLDVFEQEPLPIRSPLWDFENVILTPHTGGLTPHYFTRTAEIWAENMRRYLRGEPMTNVYDEVRGY